MRTILLLLAMMLSFVPAYAQESQESAPDNKAILEQLHGEILVLPEPPEGAPDPTSWSGVVGRLTTGQSNLKQGNEVGHPLAVIEVREGICPDDATAKCYVTLMFDISVRADRQEKLSDMVVRYVVLSREGKRLSGFAWAHERDGVKVYEYWVRRSQVWEKFEPDSANAKTESGFMNWLANIAPRTAKPKQQPPTPPGTKAEGTIA